MEDDLLSKSRQIAAQRMVNNPVMVFAIIKPEVIYPAMLVELILSYLVIIGTLPLIAGLTAALAVLYVTGKYGYKEGAI